MAEPEFTLSDRPEIAITVGGLIMAVANLEAVLFPTLARLIDQPQRIATAIFENIDNISARLSIVFELAELKKETALGAVLIRHKAGILKAVAMRNKLAHSLYGYNEGTGEVLLLHNYLTNRRDGPPRDRPRSRGPRPPLSGAR